MFQGSYLIFQNNHFSRYKSVIFKQGFKYIKKLFLLLDTYKGRQSSAQMWHIPGTHGSTLRYLHIGLNKRALSTVKIT